MTKFFVTNRREVNDFSGDPGKFVVVSITDPGSRNADIVSRPGLQSVLRLKFDDIECDRGPNYKTISKTQAKSIVRYISDNHPDVDMIVVHCEAGISRSAAVAAVMSELLEGHDSFSEVRDNFGDLLYFPNKLVMSRLREAWESLKGKTA